jgi:hypothetical protein
VKGWPAEAAGLGVAAVFFEDAKSRCVAGGKPCPVDPAIVSLLDCYGKDLGETPLCKATTQLRSATTAMTRELQSGSSASAALAAYAETVNKLNVRGGAYWSANAQVVACAVSLPSVSEQYGDVIKALKLMPEEQMGALLLGSLTASPACFSIVGKGWKPDACEGLQNGSKISSRCWTRGRPLDAPNERLEKLTTIREWSKQIHGPARAVAARWSLLKTALANYKSAVKQYQEPGSATPQLPMPTFNVGAVSDAKTFAEAVRALEAFLQRSASAAQQTQQVKLLQAGSALTHASIDFGVALTDMGTNVTDTKLFPGLCGVQGDACKGENVKAAFEQGRTILVDMSAHFDALDSALNQDWGQAVPRVLAMVRRDAVKACKAKGSCDDLVKSLSRYSGLFVAVASDSDPEHVAQALDAAAAPIGGWRRKNIPNARTVSIAAFPGFGSGAEWRVGQYGVNRERANHTYGIEPTLFMPVGVDMAWGRWVKVFVSVLDPAAFLQYDGSEGNRLPGARLTTVLSPGLAFRVVPFDAPISLLVFGMYRPGLRAWESSVTGPAADAIQVGGLISVDVTLFDLYTHDPK